MSYIETYNGGEFDYANPTVEMVDLEVMCHALSVENRFANQLKSDENGKSWTVGQHTFLVLKLMELYEHTILQEAEAFFHDFPEAYMLDVPTPLKRLLPAYQNIYDDVAMVVGDFIGLSFVTLSPPVQMADALAARIEGHVFSNKPMKWINFNKETLERFDKQLDETLIEYIEGLSYLSSKTIENMLMDKSNYYINILKGREDDNRNIRQD